MVVCELDLEIALGTVAETGIETMHEHEIDVLDKTIEAAMNLMDEIVIEIEVVAMVQSLPALNWKLTMILNLKLKMISCVAAI